MNINEVKEKLIEQFNLTGINTEGYMVKSDGLIWLFSISCFNGKWNKSYDFDTNTEAIEVTEYIDDNSWDWINARRKVLSNIDELISDIQSSLSPNHSLTDKKNSFVLKN